MPSLPENFYYEETGNGFEHTSEPTGHLDPNAIGKAKVWIKKTVKKRYKKNIVIADFTLAMFYPRRKLYEKMVSQLQAQGFVVYIYGEEGDVALAKSHWLHEQMDKLSQEILVRALEQHPHLTRDNVLLLDSFELDKLFCANY